jgi:dihydroorotate dehydrogenase (NAD+) catalytic subunit
MSAPASARGGLEPDLSVALGPLRLPHPVLNASGTYDLLEAAARYEGDLMADFPFAAYLPKTVTLEAREGNPPPRVTETPAGMINSVGLQNPGLDGYLPDLARLAKLAAPVVVNVGGSRPEDYVTVVQRLEAWLAARSPAETPDVPAYELNVSCPNVATGLAIGADAAATADLVARIKAVTERFVIVKLTPNVTSVVAIALAAEAAGADGLSLVNTFKALVLDTATLTPFLGGVTGGLCGPAIKPIALRMVAEVAGAVRIPVVGMGGVVSGGDVLEFIACGATAVQVGAANFGDIGAARRIVAELGDEMHRRGIAALADVRGRATLPPHAAPDADS